MSNKVRNAYDLVAETIPKFNTPELNGTNGWVYDSSVDYLAKYGKNPEATVTPDTTTAQPVGAQAVTPTAVTPDNAYTSTYLDRQSPSYVLPTDTTTNNTAFENWKAQYRAKQEATAAENRAIDEAQKQAEIDNLQKELDAALAEENRNGAQPAKVQPDFPKVTGAYEGGALQQALAAQNAEQAQPTATPVTDTTADTPWLKDKVGKAWEWLYGGWGEELRTLGGETIRLFNPEYDYDPTVKYDPLISLSDVYSRLKSGADTAEADKTASEIGNFYDDFLKRKEAGAPQTETERLAQEIRNLGGTPKTELPTTLERIGNAFKSGALQSASGYTNAAGTVYDATQPIRDQYNNELYQQAYKDYQRALVDYQETLAEYGWDETAPDVKAAYYILEDAKRKMTAYGVAAGTQEYASDATESLADEIAAKGATVSEEAKRGLGKVGVFLVDAGGQLVQMGGDMVMNMIVPGSGLAAMGTRSFGSAAQEARLNGASEGKQFLYGLGSAATELATEKIFGIADKLAYGAGLGDNLTETVIGALAESDVGRTVLRTLAGMAGESAEEMLADALNPILKSIYNNQSVMQNYSELELSEMLYDGLMGAAMGAFGQGVSILTGADAQANRDLRAKTMSTAIATVGEAARTDTQAAIPPKAGADYLVEAGQDTQQTAQAQLPTQTSINVNAQEASNYVGNVLAKGTATNEEVKSIISDPEKAKAFTEQTGVELTGTKSEMVATVKSTVEGEAYKPALPAPLAAEIAKENEAAQAETQSVTQEKTGADYLSEVGQPAAETSEYVLEAQRWYDKLIAAAKEADFEAENYRNEGNEEMYQQKKREVEELRAGAEEIQNEIYDRTGSTYLLEARQDGDTITATTNENADTDVSGEFNTPSEVDPFAERRADLERRKKALDEKYGVVNGVLDTTPYERMRYNAELERLNYEETQFRAEEAAEQARITQNERIANGEVSKNFGTAQNHIDNRTNESVRPPSVKSFQFDHPQLHEYFVDAAKSLLDESYKASDAITYSRMSYKNGKIQDSKSPISSLRTFMSLPEIRKCLQDIIDNNGQENYANAKRVEIVLDRMMVDGWTSINGDSHYQNEAYRSARDAIDGGVKAGSWEDYLEANSLSVISGDITEEELRHEWEAQQQQAKPEPVAETVAKSQNATQAETIAPKTGADYLAEAGQTEQQQTATPAVSDNATAQPLTIQGNADVRVLEQKCNDLLGKYGVAQSEAQKASQNGDTASYNYWTSEAEHFKGLYDEAKANLDALKGTAAKTGTDYLAEFGRKDTQKKNSDEDSTYSIKFPRTSTADTGTSTDTAPQAESTAQPTTPPTPPMPPTTPNDTPLEGDGAERERGVSKNIRTDENREEPLRQSFEEEPEMYKQLGNIKTLAKAQEIFDKGIAQARAEVEQALGRAKAGKKLSPEYVPLAKMVADELTRQGDLDGARQIIADMAAELTQAGQLGQAARILRGESASTKATVIEKLIEKINAGLKDGQKAGNIQNGRGDAEGNIKIDEELIKQYASETDPEKQNAIIDKIQQSIADQLPATFAEKFNALRYTCMLGNLKTQGRNILGNVLMGATAKAKRSVQALFSTIGKTEKNTSAFVPSDLRKQAMADFDNVEDVIRGESKYSDVGSKISQGINDKRTIFKFKPFEAYRKGTSGLMELMDVIALKYTYADTLAGWMKAHKITDISQMSDSQLETAREFAIKEAQEATFRDENNFSNYVATFDKDWGKNGGVGKVGQAVTQGVAPFRRTPANVAVRAVEYSPLGFVDALVKGVNTSEGTATGADVVNSLAKATTGSALYIAGYLMAAAGLATGGADDDDKLADYQKTTGVQDYSIKVGDTYVSYSQLAPMAIPFALGVQSHGLMSGELNTDSLNKILGAVSDPMLEMSSLQGLNDAMDNMASFNGDNNALGKFLLTSIANYITQALTNSFLGQLEQISEENRQTTYTEGGKFIGRDLQYIIGKAAAKTPGIDYNQQDYVDVWGRKQSNGTATERHLNALINPTYYSKSRATEVDSELERLYTEHKNEDGFPNVFPQKASRSLEYAQGKTMTPDEYMQYSIDRGQKSLELVTDFVKSEEYKDLDDNQRADIISRLYSFAAELAIKTVRSNNGVVHKAADAALAEVDDPIDYLSAKASATDALREKGIIKEGSGIPTSRKGLDYLVEYGLDEKNTDILSGYYLKDRQKAVYDLLRAAGMTPKVALGDFDRMDADGDGSFEQEEMYKYFTGPSGARLTEAQKEEIWANTTTGKKTWSQYKSKRK